MNGTGIVCRTAADTYTTRAITSSCGLSITNPGGIAGNVDVGLTTDTPQFARLGLGAAADATAILYATTAHATSPAAWLNQSGAGDAYLRLALAATRSYAIGIDNDDGDNLVIATAASAVATPGAGNLLTMTTAGVTTLASTFQATGLSVGRACSAGYAGDFVASNTECLVGLACFDNGGDCSHLQFVKSDTDTIGAKSQTDNGDFLGRTSYYGVNSSLNYYRAAYFDVVQNGAAGATAIPADFVFYTGTAAAAAAEVIRFTTNKRIGVNVTTPESAIEIDDAAGGADSGGITFQELTGDIAEPSANKCVIYCKDDGAGKTQLCVRFNNGGGAADVVPLATES